MAHEVTMPQMGYDMTEGTINEWRLKEGDPVARGDAIASIATDKADIDIEAYADGVLRRIVVGPGQTVPVGTVIAWIGEPGEDIPDAGAATSAADAAAPAAAPGPSGTGGAVAEPPAPEPAAAPPSGDAAPSGNGRVKASPYAPQRAAELGIDIAGLRGTGPGGRIVAQDVERAVSQAAAAAPAGQRTAPAAEEPAVETPARPP